MNLLFSDPLPSRSAAHFLGEDVDEATFAEVRQILLLRRGFDLGMYKDGCIRRRIAARVRAKGFPEPRPYLELLVRCDVEMDALMAALSIQVSQFFRNPSTFELLHRQVLPELFRRLRLEGRRELRAWSLGCAGGEEPYSLAMLLDQLVPPRMKYGIRAADISPAVLARAREGLYEPARLNGLPPGWRERYFSAEGGRWRLHEKLRRQVCFVEHNVLADQGFGEADLILCRNVLIYFSRAEQERVLRRLAACLPPGGVLVLGRAETLIGESRELFSILNPAERVFLRIGPGAGDFVFGQGAA
ncbi:CheR family methyltransferase [Geoalkalibacter sp.]|uniref:CheR family methyltransferase n=1 Tax=Geoalkalibacter sp. TaxID=3041440 RepID=UPI00272E8FCF|nr:protein-glutamate O-methyltransferase CheR [Geoalkalibacter sp.]